MNNNLVHELFDRSKNFKKGIFCTYSLNLEFFENYLLKLKGISNCSNLCVFTDRKIYNNHFNTEVTSKPKYINKRYLVIPIDTEGVFHPKLYLLASEKLVRIGVGSANLTKEGIVNNLEIVSVFEISQNNKTYCGLLKECMEFLHELALLSQSKSAIAEVEQFMNYISHLLYTEEESPVHFIHNLQIPILNKTIDVLGSKTIKSIRVISPFYDNKLLVHKFIKKILPHAHVDIYLQQGKSNFPIENFLKLSENTQLYLYKNQERYIHGKAIMFDTDNGNFLLTGSTNFTNSALLSKKQEANIETAILGAVNKEVFQKLCAPDGSKPIKLNNNGQLIVKKVDDYQISQSNIVGDWIIEASYEEGTLKIYLKQKDELIPKFVIINGDEKNHKLLYSSNLKLTTINKSELSYAQVEGINELGDVVKSGKVWIIIPEKNKDSFTKQRYHVEDPAQLTTILLDLIENGTEQELVEYLLRFNIPLDLVVFNFRGKIPVETESKGNVFGELIQQNISIYINPSVLDAAKEFLKGNMKKLHAHYNGIQLNKLDNCMLIFATVFNMMNVFNDYISTSHKKNPIDADDWVIIRSYYDMMLEHIEKIFYLFWIPSESFVSFEQLVNNAINGDKQKILGGASSFKQFISRQYEYQYKQSLVIAYKIVKQIDNYVDKCKIKTTVGTIVKAPVSNNGIKDVYILRRKEILGLIIRLFKDFKKWNV